MSNEKEVIVLPKNKGRIKKGEIKNPFGRKGKDALKKRLTECMNPTVSLALNRQLFADKIKVLFSMTTEEINYKLQDKFITSLDILLIGVVRDALQNGDVYRLEFLLNRSIGKVADELKHSSPDGTMTPQFVFEEMPDRKEKHDENPDL